MADPVDDLEAMLVLALDDESVAKKVRSIIAKWRTICGGDTVYIGQRKHRALHEKIHRLSQKGLSTLEISAQIGLTQRQVQRVRQKKSTYL